MSTPTRKRLLRFSLRTMLVVVTVLCVVLAWKVRQAERQKAAVAWLLEAGGNVTYDFELDSEGRRIPGAELPGPEWLRELVGVDYVATVIGVDFRTFVFEGTDLSPLATLSSLHWLFLANNGTTDLSPLEAMTDLENLWIERTQVTDFSPLANLTRLNTLWLKETQIADLSPLRRMADLEELNLEFSHRVSDVSPLASLAKLRKVNLRNTSVIDLTPLATLNALEELDLPYTAATNLSPLTGLEKLTWLTLEGARVSDEEVVKLEEALPQCEVMCNVLQPIQDLGTFGTEGD